jgi:hypothetical protein
VHVTDAVRFVKQITKRYPSVICIVLALATLYMDFAAGRNIRFPLLYLIPIAMAAWMGRKALAYALSVPTGPLVIIGLLLPGFRRHGGVCPTLARLVKRSRRR